MSVVTSDTLKFVKHWRQVVLKRATGDHRLFDARSYLNRGVFISLQVI